LNILDNGHDKVVFKAKEGVSGGLGYACRPTGACYFVWGRFKPTG